MEPTTSAPDRPVTVSEMRAVQAELEAKIFEQEHRLIPTVYNLFATWHADRSDPRRSSAIRAALWRMFARTPRVILVGGGGLLLGVLTLFVAVAANRLLRFQLSQMEISNELLEAQRRAGVMFELTSVLEEVTRLAAPSSAESAPRLRELPPILLARVQGLAGSLRPYRYLVEPLPSLETEVSESASPFEIASHWARRIQYEIWPGPETGRLVYPARSPERGQLLLSLAGAVDEVPWDTINLESADLPSAELPNRKLRQIRLAAANLPLANLEGTDLEAADLHHADLSNATLVATNLTNSDLSGADLTNANLSNARLTGTRLRDATLTGAILHRVVFRNVDLRDADFRNTELAAVRFEGVDVSGADFTDAQGLAISKLSGACADPERMPRLTGVVKPPPPCYFNIKHAPRR